MEYDENGDIILSKEQRMDLLKMYFEGFDDLPEHAKFQSVTLYEHQQLASLLYSILKHL
jgi:hypothetical protein